MLDRNGPVPIYVQIAEMIQGQIMSGELRVGEAVLSEMAMEAEFDVARTTVRNVVRELRRRRLVHTVRGKGTFVGPDEGCGVGTSGAGLLVRASGDE